MTYRQILDEAITILSDAGIDFYIYYVILVILKYLFLDKRGTYEASIL